MLLIIDWLIGVFKQSRGMVHGARHKFTLILLSECTSKVHQIHEKHNTIKFLCSKFLVGNTH